MGAARQKTPTKKVTTAAEAAALTKAASNASKKLDSKPTQSFDSDHHIEYKKGKKVNHNISEIKHERKEI